ncbi:MAG: hypothetical protein DHS20C16_21040 [Phycisphaerae bacterium]|nr:MAG: hypothetical protein DHS20C16_21040 [Phycisphaerae bacterium]
MNGRTQKRPGKSWRRRIVVAAFAVLGLMMVSVFSLILWLERDAAKIQGALATGRLADLPVTATNVEVETIGNMFSRQFWLRFEASPEDIEAFISESPGLAGIEPEHIGSQPSETNDRRDGDATKVADEVTSSPIGTYHDRLEWFDPEIRVRGRRYEIPWDKNANYGEVIINDETNTVYINTGHS